MALPILDGNQSATTLSTILSSGQHITAHTVVSLGTQAITDIVNATSANLTNTQLRASAVTVGGTVTVGNSLTISSLPAISGTVTANLGNVAGENNGEIPSRAVRIGWCAEDTLVGAGVDSGGEPLPIQIYLGNSVDNRVTTANPLPISGTVSVRTDLDVNSNLPCVAVAFDSPAGVQRSGIGNAFPIRLNSGVTIGAGTAQIGSVTASISGTVPVSGTFFQGTQPVSLTTLPALVAGTAQIGSVTASISNSVTIASLPAISGTVTANTFALQGTAVTTSNFTSTTASTVLANFNASREVLTIFNEGAGNLHICAGATCTTIAYQVRLSAGDYYEVPNHQTTITHSAVFATAGTARVTEVS